MPKQKAPVNRSQKVRDYLKENPKAGPREVTDALVAQGIECNVGLVSNVLTKKRKKAAAEAADQSGASDQPTAGQKAAATRKANQAVQAVAELVRQFGLKTTLGCLEEVSSAYDLLGIDPE